LERDEHTAGTSPVLFCLYPAIILFGAN